MARYIDADALIENIKRVYCTDCNNYNEVRCRACGTDDALDMIEDAPTADVSPKSEVAEIFAEIEKIRAKEIHRCEVMREKEKDAAERKYWEGGEHALLQLSYWFAELKKIHTNN